MHIETPRLILRPWREADAPALYQYAKDPRVGPVAGWPPHTSEENSLEVIRGVLSLPETYAVMLRETGEPVGSIGIMQGPDRSSAANDETEAEIGYWIGVPYWGRALIPEAVEAMLLRCFVELHCTLVWCGYHEGNTKSARVQDKCGFIYHHAKDVVCELDGSVREHYTRQTRDEWAARTGLRPGRYRHFKGNEYELLAVARHSETGEAMVVYRALYGERGIWTRPAAMWGETVEREGVSQRRFEYIGS